MCKVPCFLCCGICSPCLLEGKRDKEKKVGNLLGIFCDFGLLAVVCDVHCGLSLVLE